MTDVRTSRRPRLKRVLAVVLAVLFVGYWVLVNLLVSAALVPSFMEKLDAFEEVTEVSYSQQVRTSDIQENRKAALRETKAWVEEHPPERLEAESADGYTLVAARFPAETASRRWVILLHGYTGWKEEMYPFALWYWKQGFNVLVPDLRCQGESQGDFIGMGWTDRLDVRMWMDGILREDPEAEIVLHGQSMGAACALMLSGMADLPENLRAVVSDCGYTDAYSMFRQDIKDWFGLPAFPLVDSANLALQVRGGYDLRKASALKAVGESRVPTLIIHGDRDKMISVDMAYALYEAAAPEKELLIVEGAGHAQSQDKDPAGYYGTLEKFLGKYLT